MDDVLERRVVYCGTTTLNEPTKLREVDIGSSPTRIINGDGSGEYKFGDNFEENVARAIVDEHNQIVDELIAEKDLWKRLYEEARLTRDRLQVEIEEIHEQMCEQDC